MLTKLSTVFLCGLAALAVGAQAETLKLTPDQINIQDKPEFMASVGIQPNAVSKLTKKDKTPLAQDAFNEKASQHVMSKHYEKGISCNTCHDAHTASDPAWMAVVSKPAIRKDCKDCHTVQADVLAQTDTHDKMDCIACHMPNVSGAGAYSPDQAKAPANALRRVHVYKINVDPKAGTMVEAEKTVDGKKVKEYVLAKNEDGRGYVDLMWSCARNTPADYTVFEAQGCHNAATSTLDQGLVYQDQKEVYGEVMKWQNPVKEGYDKINGAVKRLTKLLEVTKLSPADQTEARLLLDKARDIAVMLKKDGSWGVHAPRYLKDRVATAQAFLAKAQLIIDQGGYVKTAAK